jgi:hypothetical protein
LPASTILTAEKFAALYIEAWRRKGGRKSSFPVDRDIANIIEHSSSGDRISVSQLKGAVNPNSLGSDTTFVDYSNISGGFIASLVNADAFDRLVGSMISLPMRTATVGAVSVAALAYQIVERDMKPLSRFSFTSQTVDPLKVVSGVILTQELLRFMPPGTVQLVEDELRKGVALTTDTAFISTIISGITPFTSTGSTGESVRADLSRLLETLTLGADSKLFIITTSLICKRWSMLSDQHGVAAFPNLTPQGGSIQGIPVIVSDGVASGIVVLVDASGLGGNVGEAVLTTADQGSYQFSDVPDSPAGPSTNWVSLWQMNQISLQCERYFLVERLRANSVATISNSNSYSSGNSPP